MGLHLIKSKIDNIQERLLILQGELNEYDAALNSTSPGDLTQVSLAFDAKVEEFNELQERFKVLLEEYNEISNRESNTVNFTAKKLLKVMS